jgi:hypothetical protein
MGSTAGNNPNSFTPWQNLSPMGVGQSGSVPYGPQGGNPPVTYRDSLDARRSGAYGLSTGYPDGYLDNLHNRREGRLDSNGGTAGQLPAPDPRESQKAFSRGVHRGERIPPNEYFWPKEFSLMSGIARQAATGERFVPLGQYVEAHGPNLASVQQTYSGNLSNRAAQLRAQSPSYQ